MVRHLSEIGYIIVRNGIKLPIVDCKQWRVVHGIAECGKALNLDECASCSSRISRDGNFIDPPIVGNGRVTVSAPAAITATDAVSDSSKNHWRGLGDVVASATKAMGIKTCGGCAARREALNKLVPFKPIADATDGTT